MRRHAPLQEAGEDLNGADRVGADSPNLQPVPELDEGPEVGHAEDRPAVHGPSLPALRVQVPHGPLAGVPVAGVRDPDLGTQVSGGGDKRSDRTAVDPPEVRDRGDAFGCPLSGS